MRFGPTSLRLTSILAKRRHRPKLREDLKFSKQIVAGEVSYIAKIPETANYVRFGEFAFELLELCDGTRTPAELAAEICERHPEESLSEGEVVEWLDDADPNIWERTLGEKNLAILEKIRDERDSRVNRSSLLYIYFSAWDPDRVLTKTHPYLKFFFTRGFIIFSIVLFFLTAVIVVSDWPRIRQDTIEFYTFTNKSAYDLWIFWVLLFVVSGVHEFGHGLTCKHFGGEVHQMGLMLMYFTPSFYTDCTDMYMFDRGSKRLWTIFAGIWVELVLCALATFVWYLSPPGSFIGDLGYKTLLLTGVSGVFINLNPLMKFDGYFALSQYLEIESLREDSFAYMKAWLQRYLLRQDVDLPHVGRRKARVLLAFGLAAFWYSVLILSIVIVFVKNVFTSRFGGWGYPLTVVVLYMMLHTRVEKWIPGMRSGWNAAKEKLMAWKVTRLQVVGGVVVLGLLLLLPTATKVITEFVLEPGARAEVRAPVAGWVAEARVHEGDAVAEGAVLAVLRNPEVEARATILERELQSAERTLLAARARGDLGALQAASGKRESLATEVQQAREDREGLTLRAPLAGVTTQPQIEQRVGEFLNEGDRFEMIVDRQKMRARILVRDWELEEVTAGSPVKMNLRAYPLRTFSGKVEQILPAAALDRPVTEPAKLERRGQEVTNYFAVVLEFPNEEGLLREGLTGTAKIYGARYPLGWRAGRAVWRWVKSQVW
jgi:putative peptide zinc metalloprotease protein